MDNLHDSPSTYTQVMKYDNSQTNWDIILGVLLLILSLFGTSTNACSLRYFVSTGKRNLSTLLYIAICCVDICTCSVPALAVCVSLFGQRRPIIFSVPGVCVSWWTLFRVSHYGSMCLVMLLSVSRTISMKFPFVQQSRRVVLSIFAGFVSFLIVYCVSVSELIPSDSAVIYSPLDVHCFLATEAWPPTDSPIVELDTVIVGVITGVIPLVCFMSFLVSCQVLSSSLSSHTGAVSTSASRKKRAAVTVTIFTATFILCNLPYFVVTVLYFVSLITAPQDYPEPFFSSFFMENYAWLLSKVHFTVLNAALNPALYFLRFRGFRGSVQTGRDCESAVSDTRSGPRRNTD